MWLKLILICVFGFTNSLTSTFEMGELMSGNRMAGVPLGRSLGDGELDLEGICSAAGMACLNCSHAVTCVALPSGYLRVPLQECPKLQSCNAHDGGCSDQVVPECDVVGQKYQHICEQVGIFPDAYDCRKFHLCSPPDGLPDGRPADHRTALCPRHYGYNPQTAQCSVKLYRGQCSEKPVPDCIGIGQTDVLPSSPNHYYVCLQKGGSLYPQIFICPHGWFFWDGFCRPEPPYPAGNTGPQGGNGGNDGFSAGNSGSPGEDHGTTGEENGTTGEDNYASGGDNAPEDHNVLQPDNGRPPNREKIFEGNADPDATDRYRPVHYESTTRAVPSRIESFFSTDKAVTYAADTFLADKFDIANYESTDDVAQFNDEFATSFESGVDFW